MPSSLKSAFFGAWFEIECEKIPREDLAGGCNAGHASGEPLVPLDAHGDAHAAADAERGEASLLSSTAETRDATTHSAPMFQDLSQAKWEKILPELGDASPEIAILHVDPNTQATKLLIRSPSALHVRKHWHSANETHTMILGKATFGCEGKKVELGPGGFNYMPARMVHEAWTTAGSVVFITVDGPWDVNWVEGPPTSADLIE